VLGQVLGGIAAAVDGGGEGVLVAFEGEALDAFDEGLLGLGVGGDGGEVDLFVLVSAWWDCVVLEA